MEWKASSCDIAVLGMAVMGKNLALNFADHGAQVAIYNRTTARAQDAAIQHPEQHLMLSETLPQLVASLKRPRCLLMMVKAGEAVDMLIEQLIPLLEPGDILMDGGNSYFKDTARREASVQSKGILYLGVGVSGGEEGARRGPAIMPGGSQSAYASAGPLLERIAAQAPDGTPCCAYMGSGGAGHYVKMVHNGIEYADMQLLAELVQVLRALGWTEEAIASWLESWEESDLASYLSQITAIILREKDPGLASDRLPDPDSFALSPTARSAGSDPKSKLLLSHILDLSLQKGTGKWTNQEAIHLGVDLSVLASGLNARFMSEEKELRVETSTFWSSKMMPPEADKDEATLPSRFKQNPWSKEDIGRAFLLARLTAYAQGFYLYRKASAAYGWTLPYRDIAATFRNGCIIRSALLESIMKAFDEQPDLPHLLLSEQFMSILSKGLLPLRRLSIFGRLHHLALPAFNASLTYLDALSEERGTGNLIAAQRDYFGAHQFRRIEGPGLYHHKWPGATEE